MSSRNNGDPDAELRRLRTARGVSLGDLARRADVPKASLVDWEGGRYLPPGPALDRLLLVPDGASPFSVTLVPPGGDVDPTDIRAIGIDSNAVPASADSTITRIRSIQPVATPGPAALPFALMALKRRKRA